MTLAEDVAAALTAAGYSNITLEFTQSPDAQIGIFYGGGSGYIHSSGDIEKIPVQIQVRDAPANRKVAEERAYAIKTLLHKSELITGAVSCIWDGRYPIHFSDENGRHKFAVEFLITIST